MNDSFANCHILPYYTNPSSATVALLATLAILAICQIICLLLEALAAAHRRLHFVLLSLGPLSDHLPDDGLKDKGNVERVEGRAFDEVEAMLFGEKQGLVFGDVALGS